MQKLKGIFSIKDQDIATFLLRKLNKLRGKEMGMIFQDPLTALNPLMIIGDQIDETLYLHNKNLSTETTERKGHRIIE